MLDIMYYLLYICNIPFSTLKKQKKPMIHVFKRMIGFSVD